MAINSVIADGPHAAPLASTPYTFPIAVGTKVSAAFAYFLGWRIGIPASVTLDGVSMTYVDQINDQAGLFALYNPGVLSGTTVNLAFTSAGSKSLTNACMSSSLMPMVRLRIVITMKVVRWGLPSGQS